MSYEIYFYLCKHIGNLAPLKVVPFFGPSDMCMDILYGLGPVHMLYNYVCVSFNSLQSICYIIRTAAFLFTPDCLF